MPPAKAHPYLVSFGKLGLIEQDALTGRYGLGPFALQMGLAALHGVDPLRVALTEIAHSPTRSSSTSPSRSGATMGRPSCGSRMQQAHPCKHASRYRHDPAHGLRHRPPLRRLPAGPHHPPDHRGGLSRLVLTDQPAPRASRKLADEMLAEVRRHGLARALGNPIPGINAFSAPVFDSGGNIALCITAMGPAGTFETEWDSPTASKLLGCAQEISRRLGFAARQA